MAMVDAGSLVQKLWSNYNDARARGNISRATAYMEVLQTVERFAARNGRKGQRTFEDLCRD